MMLSVDNPDRCGHCSNDFGCTCASADAAKTEREEIPASRSLSEAHDTYRYSDWAHGAGRSRTY